MLGEKNWRRDYGVKKNCLASKKEIYLSYGIIYLLTFAWIGSYITNAKPFSVFQYTKLSKLKINNI